MKYILFVIQLILSIFLATMILGIVSLYIVDLNSYLYVILHLSLIFFCMKITNRWIRKLGWPALIVDHDQESVDARTHSNPIQSTTNDQAGNSVLRARLAKAKREKKEAEHRNQ